METFPTSVFKVRIWIVATTTKICTSDRSTLGYPISFDADHHALLLVDTYAQFAPKNKHALRQRVSLGHSLKRHPFSGLVHSAGELLHTP